ncbi:MAG: cob(I)yrinic acid a,c-diamide adenosyltransferase [Desulfobacterales bacterium]
MPSGSLTGHYAHHKVVAAADLVPGMKEVTHYYQNGLQGRFGTEK